MKNKIKQMRKKILLSSVVVLMGLGIIFGCVFSNMVAADSNYYTEALASVLIDCINDGIFKTTVKASDLNGSYYNFVQASGKSRWTPLGFMNTEKDPALGRPCNQIIGKLVSNKGISVPSASSTFEQKNRFLASLGYRRTDSNSSQNTSESCFRFIYRTTYNGNSVNDTHSPYVCVNTDANGNVVGDSITVSGGSTIRTLTFSASNGTLKIIFNNRGSEAMGGKTATVSLSGSNSMTFESLKSKVKSTLLSLGAGTSAYQEDTVNEFGGEYTYNILDAEGNANIQNGNSDDLSAEYTLTIDDNSKRLITGTLIGSSINTYPSISDDDKFNMYQDYMTKYYAADTQCGLTQDEASIKVANQGYVETTHCSADGGTQPCYAKATKNENLKVGGVENHFFGYGKSFSDIAGWLANYGKTNNTCPAKKNDDDSSSGGSSSVVDTSTSKCETVADQVTDGKIGAMQWILCPTMDNAEHTASWIDDITQDWLEVDSNIYDSNSMAKTVWEYIRNIADIVMVIFLLVVVVSQLTGYGIDNYGIKKMLPRLIVMAILVNLSFYICQIAIDLSNILGKGLNNMFSSIGNYAGSGFIDTMTTGFMAAAGAASTGGGAAVGVGITAVTLGASVAVAVIIAVIVLCLVILVAVMVLFLMLGAREVMIIFCIIMAPLAFAAFILPNTQNLFKKWWDVFKAAIIIFPLCGALSGISNLLRSIAENGAELPVWTFAVVLILPYLGFFLLPMLLKNAIAAMGKVGGALTSLGNTVRNGGRSIGQGAMRVAQNTEGYKNMQTEAARRRQADSSERTIRRLEALKKERRANGAEEGKELTATEARRLYDAQQTQTKLRYEQEMADLGAVVPSDEAIKSRAESAKDTQELKLLTDSYSGFTRSQMTDELSNAYVAYMDDKSDANGLRFRAALTKADSMGMDKELLNVLNGKNAVDGRTDLIGANGAPLSQLGFTVDENREDAKVATTMAGLNNKLANRFGKQLGKDPTTNLSFNGFATNAGAGGLSEAITSKGPDYLNGLDEDSFGFLHDISTQTGRNVVNTETLLHASSNTTDKKVNANIARMIANANPNEATGMTGKILVNQRDDSLKAITSKVAAAGEGSVMRNEFMKATNDIANSPELLANLRADQAAEFNRIRGDNLFKVEATTGGSGSGSSSGSGSGNSHTPTFEGDEGI